MSSNRQIQKQYFPPLTSGGGGGLPAASSSARAWDMTASAARRNGAKTNLVTRALTSFAVGRVEREFAVEQVRQYFQEAMGVNAVRLSEAAAVSKERIITESAKASAELQLIIQRIADEFINDVTGQFSQNSLRQAEQAHRDLSALDRALMEGRISPQLAEGRRASIEQVYERALEYSTTVVNQMLTQSLERIRRALGPGEGR